MTQGVPEDLTFDMKVMKVRELKLIKAMTGKDFKEITRDLSSGGVDVDVIHALALVALQRVNPNATAEDAEEVNVMALMDGVEVPDAAPKGKKAKTP